MPDEQKTMSYFINQDFLIAEESYNETSDVLRETISRFKVNQAPSFDRSADSSFRDSNNNHFQLPRISLPKFSGKFSEWESFNNTFESLVANNDLFSNKQKFYYLYISFNGYDSLLFFKL